MTQSESESTVLRNTHDFFLHILRTKLGHDIPLPVSLDYPSNRDVLVRWLNLLDLAITAPMMRDALRETTAPNITSSLLRYYISKQTRTETDRDKADFVVTSLFRSPDPPDLWDARGVYFRGGKTYSHFEPHLVKMLGMTAVPDLPNEHQQLIREFGYVADEVEDYRHFDALIDSGVMQRVRDIKHSLGKSFYHPTVLSMIAAYNVFFGHRFDRLFHEATQQIKDFASKVVAEGGSIMSRVDGDVILKQLTDVQEQKILSSEYGKAQDDFRQISKYKKAVDHRRGAKEAPAVAAAAAAIPAPQVRQPKRTPAIMPPSPFELNGMEGSGVPIPAEASPSMSLEEAHLKSMAETVRNFLRAADPKSAHIVPVRYGNLPLTQAEIEAFRANYSGEKSFRADYVNALVSVVSLIGRMGTELADFKAKRNSAYQWKPHADALSVLLNIGREINNRAMTVAELAERRGLSDKSDAIQASLAKLRDQVQMVAETLQTLGTGMREGY
ncbi:MAG TPA: hypothetical protein VFU86_14670 [Terriglobales bacterium]|nr:hypothetical protein [Terriglobales bacterium]